MADIRTAQVTPRDALGVICSQMTPRGWGADNEMTQYDETTLKDIVSSDKNLLFLAWDDDQIAGSALCYEQRHPNGVEKTVYVHELDTHPDYRRNGVATQLMEAVFEEAKARGLSEVWVGADHDNVTAHRFYESLSPTDVDPSIIYTYKV